jgi:DNA uptake protein ComE-like DNA-binding protein
MKFNWKPVNSWFGFSRRERRSTFVLLLIIGVVLGVRYVIPDTNTSFHLVPGFTVADVNSLEAAQTARQTGLGETAAKKRSPTYTPYEKTTKYSSARTGLQSAVKKYPSAKRRQLIEINSSDSATLVALPGIGPVLANRIIRYRSFLGGYASADQLREVYGLQEETYVLIRPMVFADSSAVSRVDINSADFKGLTRVRYLEKYEINAILKYRQVKGAIGGFDDLTENKLLTAEKLKKVRPYLKFRD